jgi:phosphotransferase family enzyme
VSIISATPDLAVVCRDLLGADLADAQRIGTGRNSRVFRVTVHAPDLRERQQTFVMKFYRRDVGDTRERLLVEFGGLTFLWENGVRTIPHPVKADGNRNCAIYEYIPGESAGHGSIDAVDIDACVDFLAELKPLRSVNGADRLPMASEAGFSIAAIEAGLRSRIDRLRASQAWGDGAALHAWMAASLLPLFDNITAWGRAYARQAGIEWDTPIGRGARTLSPSDFGFHNAIRRPGRSLAFVDFEYFGWDDPAKTLVDFLLHPGMAVPEALKHRYADRLLAVFSDVPGLAARSRIVYPLFGLKWCLIILNDFLPERRQAATDEARSAQFSKAAAMAQQIEAEFTANRYLM